MALIIQQALSQQLRPSENRAYAKWTSTLSNILYYEVEVVIATQFTNTPTYSIGTFIAEPTPGGDYKTAVFETSRIINPYVKELFKYNDLDAANVGYNRHLENMLLYNIIIREVYLLNGVKTRATTTQTMQSFFYKGLLDQISISTYDTERLFLRTTNANVPTSPLVHWMNKYPKGQFKTTFKDSKEWLYLLTSYLGQQLEMRVSYNNNTQTKVIYNNLNEVSQGVNWRPVRFDVSPSFIFSLAELETLKNYEIQIWKKAATQRQLTETFRYDVKESNCANRTVLFYFQNSFGVYEPIKLNNPATQSLTNRETIKLNNYDTDRYGNYTNYNDITNPRSSYIYNQIDKVIGTTLLQDIRFYTNPLSENDMFYLQELLNSKKIYMEIGEGKYVPVLPLEENYDMTPYRYRDDSGGSRVKEFNFRLPENFDVNYIDFATNYSQAEDNYVIGYTGTFI